MFFVPELFDVAVDVREGDFATDEEPQCEVGVCVGAGLDQLVALVVDVVEDLVQLAGLEAGVGQGVQRGH